MNNPAACLNELVVVVDRLEHVLEAETDCLKRMQVSEASGLLSEKTRLAEAYERVQSSLAEDPTPFKLLTAGQREGLRDILDRFRRVLADNERAILAAKGVGERVIETIISAVKQDRLTNAGYSKEGVLAAGPRGGKAVTLSLNQAI
ncbi:MAG: hypothetical protein HYR63_14980 [Proteobacteria bacterium]|nr:hypothetical protein [Pseudomonadota bacterium]